MSFLIFLNNSVLVFLLKVYSGFDVYIYVQKSLKCLPSERFRFKSLGLTQNKQANAYRRNGFRIW